MPAPRRRLLGLTFAILYGCLGWTFVAGPLVAHAAPTAKQRREAAALQTEVRKAGSLFKQGKFEECAKLLEGVQEKAEKFAADGPDAAALLEGVYQSLEKAHALLELEGVILTPLRMPAASTPGGATPDPAGTTPAAGAGGVSFKGDVAKVLVARCGRCHINRSEGEFSVATFDDLMKGPPAGKVVFAGDAVGSRLIEVIESGDMPRGGGKVGATELETLKKWILEGARFDGDDPAANLGMLANATQAEMPALAVAAATGKETISFAKDIAPVLVKNCTVCHGDRNNPGADLNLSTFANLLRGGDSGAPLAPGNAAESLIVQKLEGTAGGQRMPLRQPPLEEAVIAKFKTWIAEGATFDGPDPAQNIAQVAALARAKAATHEELSADRAQRALEAWRLGLPGVTPARSETTNFLLLGNVGEATLADFGAKAEAMAPQVAAMFKLPADEPLIKGRLTLYLFANRYDYSEFGQMVEKRELPKELRGHWRFNIVDAYGAFIAPKGDEFSAEVLIAQQLAGAYVASLGTKVPHWFAEGSARVIASRLGGGDPRVIAWNAELPAVAASLSQPDDFLTGKLPAEAADIASYSFVEFLMKQPKPYEGLLNRLRAGEDFDKAFSEVYRGSPNQVAAAWLPAALKKRAPRPPRAGAGG